MCLIWRVEPRWRMSNTLALLRELETRNQIYTFHSYGLSLDYSLSTRLYTFRGSNYGLYTLSELVTNQYQCWRHIQHVLSFTPDFRTGKVNSSVDGTVTGHSVSPWKKIKRVSTIDQRLDTWMFQHMWGSPVGKGLACFCDVVDHFRDQ